jgi:mono/diheme cytochrome c family protein
MTTPQQFTAGAITAGSPLSRALTFTRASDLCGAITLATGAHAQGINNGKGKVAERFAELCANCHGKNLAGAQAPSLLKDE